MNYSLISRAVLALCAASLFVASCRQPTEPVNESPATPPARGLYVLNEGLFQRNNSTLTLYSFDSARATTDFFERVNGRRLGDTGNDLLIAGDKLFIVVNVSSQIEVVNVRTGRSLRTIPLFNGTVARQPRRMTLAGGRMFVSCFDGTVAVIDTASLQVVSTIAVGANPDGITVQNGKVYVANSGGLNRVPDSTVSILNPTTLAQTARIVVRQNPTGMAADAFGDVYVSTSSVFNADFTQVLVPSRLLVVDANRDVVKQTYNFGSSGVVISGDVGYVRSGGGIITINVRADTVLNSSFLTRAALQSAGVQTLYGLAIDEQNGDIYVTDAKNFTTTGEVFCFSRDGQRKFSFVAGLNPSSMAFLR
ncbi:MAG: hypothetical protein HY22_14470 [[Candidatus Thermochlorobacteriaceae] bacterium GBChlB]|nr:MAG: hypothetical protein HY22_14470 [[Candidatus Thermochlorobacteriaceae] bacterium GBChlB]